ncbi:hypothetical protein [Myceligenerans indicum]|uniref:V-type ATPase subunit n=1 Tax=Myceligenerans indicum TaxID=2593663 RepID=A0ABS1LGQ1_9MICO|nr:hypothetical protein [Myceligenerans indicum]MBL0885406.1 hypothetical protein [Myceligenerans indicum]
MTVAWIAGNVRAAALLDRRVGSRRAREMATSSSLDRVLHALADGPYQREVRPGQDLAQAQHGIAAALLWHLRVLAGWQPRAGSEALRVLAGWFEAANVCEHARALAGLRAEEPYRLGALSLAWHRLAATTSTAELRSTLADSPWGDPGAGTPEAIAVAVWLGWADRVRSAVPAAAAWAAGGAALLVARHRFLDDAPLSEPAGRRAARVLGASAVAARSLGEFTTRLPTRARWSMSGVETVADLWTAEARWWTHVERDAQRLRRTPRFDPSAVIGVVALLAVDARRLRAALELAAHGGEPLEAYDAVV